MAASTPASPDKRPEMIHATRIALPTSIPATAASERSSAIARSTRPVVVRERKSPTAAIVTAAVAIAITCASESRTLPSTKTRNGSIRYERGSALPKSSNIWRRMSASPIDARKRLMKPARRARSGRQSA
jgi:hypothetical protein